MIRTVGRALLVLGAAAFGGVLCAGLFWMGSDQDVIAGPLIAWGVGGAVMGALAARALLVD